MRSAAEGWSSGCSGADPSFQLASAVKDDAHDSSSVTLINEETFRPPLFQSVPCPAASAVAGVPAADL